MRADVKGQTSIRIIDKVSNASDMIELEVSFAINIPCIKHYVIVIISLMTADELRHKFYCSKNKYLN